MSSRLAALLAVFLLLAPPASAHRLDEYLQALLLTVGKDRVQVSMRLIPGVAVSSSVISTIDRDGNGLLSPEEQQAYALHVLSQWSFTEDGRALKPVITSFSFPTVDQMREGIGEIHLEVTAKLPQGSRDRHLQLVDLHPEPKAAYLINALVPADPDVRISAQTRNEQQSSYQLDYTQTGTVLSATGSSGDGQFWPGASSFVSLFRLGIRHIAEGTDHLLFLLVLLLPAPLIASGARWSGIATTRHSVLGILRIVTAFTLGHSLTLALAAFGIVSIPGRPVEVLIAVSILVSAVNAWRPIFPGREAVVAACFGLVHGLAFATTLTQLGLGRWQRLAGLLAFNLGIETMQLIVVLITMPSLLLLSRTAAYPLLRYSGALFAGLASLGWIAERLFKLPNIVEPVVDFAAQHALLIACALLLVSLLCFAFRRHPRHKPHPAFASD